VEVLDYRHHYAIYKTDPDLQAAHASTPFINNWAADISEEETRPELFLMRRAAAFHAWYEHMPVRRALMPRGPDILVYRRFAIAAPADGIRTNKLTMPFG
jgi:alkaline phosphatase D